MPEKSKHRQRAFLLAFTLAAILPMQLPSQGAAPDPAVAQLLQNGATAMRQGKPAEAEADFRQATAAAPSLPDAWLGLGMAQLREGKPGEAQQSLQKSIDLNPSLRGAHLFLGIAQYQTNDLEAAASTLQVEVHGHPDNVEALTWLGIVELGAGHADLATAPLDRAAQLSPKDPNILDYRGRAHALVAQESYRALTDLDPDSWRVHRALGEIAAESRQWQSAIDEYQKAIAKSPNNPDLYESLGEAQQRLSRFDEATKSYETELQFSPNNPIALYNLGRSRSSTATPPRESPCSARPSKTTPTLPPQAITSASDSPKPTTPKKPSPGSKNPSPRTLPPSSNKAPTSSSSVSIKPSNQGEIRRWVEQEYGEDGPSEDDETPFYVRAEIIVDPDGDEIVETAIAGNTATPVKSISQAGARGHLDELEKSIAKIHPDIRIRKSETDEDVFDTRKILQYARILMPREVSGNDTPAEKLRPCKNPEQCQSDFSEWFDEKGKRRDALLEQNQHNCTHRQKCQPGFFARKNPTAQIPDRGHLC